MPDNSGTEAVCEGYVTLIIILSNLVYLKMAYRGKIAPKSYML
jgi:hypothetical protein